MTPPDVRRATKHGVMNIRDPPERDTISNELIAIQPYTIREIGDRVGPNFRPRHKTA